MRKSRLHERGISYWWIVGLSLLVSLPVLAIGRRLEGSFGGALSYMSLPLTFVVPILFDRRTQNTRSRTVRFVDYRVHHYGTSIYRGVREELAASGRRWETQRFIPDPTLASQPLEQQVSDIRGAVADDVDALIVLPLATSDELWDATAFAMQAGVEVLILDVRPPRARFERQGLEVPLSVSTDYSAGGKILGQLIGQRLHEDDTAMAILCMGPSQHYAGAERSRQALGELTDLGLHDRLIPLVLPDWDLTPAQLNEVSNLVTSRDHAWWIYVGYDHNAIRMHNHLRDAGRWRSNLHLIGYDATTSDLGEMPVFDYGRAAATMNVKPEDQGREAARMLVYRRIDPDLVRSSVVVVPPELVTRDSYLASHPTPSTQP